MPHDVCEAALAHIRKDKTGRAYQRGDLLDRAQSQLIGWVANCEPVWPAKPTRSASRRAPAYPPCNVSAGLNMNNNHKDQIPVVLSFLDDARRLIEAGKVRRWEVFKWTVAINILLTDRLSSLKPSYPSLHTSSR